MKRLNNVKELCNDIRDIKAIYDNGYVSMEHCVSAIYGLLGVEKTPEHTEHIEQYLKGLI